MKVARGLWSSGRITACIVETGEIYTGRLIGLVYNGTATSIESVTLRMRYFNASGGLIRTDTFSGLNSALLYVLEPDTVAPFVADLTSFGGPPPATAGWELTAWGSSCPKWAMWPTVEVTVVEDLGSGMHYAGTITNDTPYTLSEMRVTIIREHDATGYFGDIGRAILGGPFAPGASQGWEMWTQESSSPGEEDYLFTEGLKAATTGGLLLTQATGLAAESASGIYTVAEDVNELLVIGGTLAVSDWTYQQAHYLCR
ncbi:MAG: hypothetical protein WBI63_02800 [Coriobacteriia bacterium]